MKFPQQPILFISKPFFINFVKKIESKFTSLTAEEQKLIPFLHELIFNKSTLYFDLEQKAIAKITEESFAKIDDLTNDEDEKLFIVYFRMLIERNGNLIQSCRSDLQIIKSLETKRFTELKVLPTFLLISEDNDYCRSIEAEWGIISVSKSLNIAGRALTDLIIENIMAASCLNIEDFFSKLPNCYSVVIEDPYLLKTGDYIIELIDSILGKKLTNKPLKITLITNYDGNKNVLMKIRERFTNKVELEHIEGKNIHDRNIYSNSYWLTSDYGFMKTYNKPTKWVVYPLGVYYGKFYERLGLSLKGVKNELKINNYLTVD